MSRLTLGQSFGIRAKRVSITHQKFRSTITFLTNKDFGLFNVLDVVIVLVDVIEYAVVYSRMGRPKSFAIS